MMDDDDDLPYQQLSPRRTETGEEVYYDYVANGMTNSFNLYVDR